MKKMHALKGKAQELAKKFGVSQEIADSFSYEDEEMEKEPKMQIVYDADNDSKNIQLSADRLRSLIERVERLEEEKAAIGSDIRDVFAEAKSAGFDVKCMRAVIKLRKMNAADRDEQELLLDTYCKALDM
mgnify:CR=1 FL=1